MAAERTETTIYEKHLTGGGLIGIYTVVTSATDDWIVLDNFEVVQWAKAYTTADGTNQKAYTDGTNKCYLAITGTATVMVFGTSVKSTGGAT